MQGVMPRPLAWAWPSVAALLIPVAVIGWLVGPMLSAEFGMVDDHWIIAMTGPDGRVWPWEWPGVVADFTLVGDGRFRPGWMVLQTTEAMLWGRSPEWWYLSRFALALATVAGVIALAWPLPWMPLAALAVMPFAGPQAEAWYRLGPQEAYAMPLLVGGLAAIRWRRGWVAVGLLIAAGLTKEAFALALPIVVAGWWYVERWTRPLVTLAVATVALCAVVGWVQLGGDFYGLTRTPASVLSAGVTMLVVLTASTAWLLPGVAALGHPIARAALALLVTQAFVYVALEGRYFAPTVVGVILVAAVGFRRVPSWIAVAVLVLMLPSLWTQHQRAEHWAESSRTFQSWIAEVDAHPGPILIEDVPGNPEPAESVGRYLTWPRPEGECAEVMFSEPSGRCPTTFRVRGVP